MRGAAVRGHTTISILALFGLFNFNQVPVAEAFIIACCNIHQSVVELFLTNQPHVLGGFSAHWSIAELALGMILISGLIFGGLKSSPPIAMVRLIRLGLLLPICDWWAKSFTYVYGISVFSDDKVHGILFDGFICALGNLAAYAMVAVWLPSNWQRKPRPVPLSVNVVLLYWHGRAGFLHLFIQNPPWIFLGGRHRVVAIMCVLAIFGVGNTTQKNGIVAQPKHD